MLKDTPRYFLNCQIIRIFAFLFFKCWGSDSFQSNLMYPTLIFHEVRRNFPFLVEGRRLWIYSLTPKYNKSSYEETPPKIQLEAGLHVWFWATMIQKFLVFPSSKPKIALRLTKILGAAQDLMINEYGKYILVCGVADLLPYSIEF